MAERVGRHLTDARAGHRAARLAPLPSRRLLARSDLGALHGRWSRTGCAAPAHRLADEISDRFRALCEQSGFAENFDALTGQGLRDRAYTWTAAST